MRLKANNIIVLLFFTLFISCLNPYTTNIKEVALSQDIIYKWKTKKFIIVLPCTRCGCFLSVINNFKGRDSLFIVNETTFVTDTFCNKIKFKSIHREQKQIDSLSDEIYNLTLISINKSETAVRIIDTKESEQTTQIMRSFFDY